MNVPNQSLPASITRFLSLIVLPICLTASLGAQPTQETKQQIESPSDSDLKTALVFSYSYSPESDLERGTKIGDVSISHFDLGLNASKRLSENLTVLFGLSDKYTDLEFTGTTPLPDQLHAVGISVGAKRKLDECFGPAWSGTVRLQTEFSSDSSGLSEAKPSFGGAVFVSHQQSPTFAWDFGILGRSHGDLPVLPLVGARWSFAPKWMASLGFPRTGLTYDYSQRLSLHAGVSFDGGLYHVSAERAPGLGNTWLEYNEVRAGVRLEYRINPRLKLTLGGGAVVDREFDYYDRNYSIDGGSAGYLSIGLEARF